MPLGDGGGEEGGGVKVIEPGGGSKRIEADRSGLKRIEADSSQFFTQHLLNLIDWNLSGSVIG